MLTRFNKMKLGIFAALTALMLMVPGMANAQTEPPTTFLPYDTLANSGKTEIGSAVGAYAPVVIGIVVGMVCLGVLIAWLSRAPKKS